MTDTVPTRPQDTPHPPWCSPENCTARRGSHGTHRGENISVALESQTLRLYLELHRPPSVPLLIVEQRGCSSLECECEPTAVIGLRIDPARVLLAAMFALVGDLGSAPEWGGKHAPGCDGDHIGPCSLPAGDPR